MAREFVHTKTLPFWYPAVIFGACAVIIGVLSVTFLPTPLTVDDEVIVPTALALSMQYYAKWLQLNMSVCVCVYCVVFEVFPGCKCVYTTSSSRKQQYDTIYSYQLRRDGSGVKRLYHDRSLFARGAIKSLYLFLNKNVIFFLILQHNRNVMISSALLQYNKKHITLHNDRSDQLKTMLEFTPIIVDRISIWWVWWRQAGDVYVGSTVSNILK